MRFTTMLLASAALTCALALPAACYVVIAAFGLYTLRTRPTA